MYFELLCSLYLGKSTNADLSTPAVRRMLHISTELDRLIPEQLRASRDIVLTGNPGDGKSHLVRLLLDSGKLPNTAEVEPDLSAASPKAVLARWSRARAERRPFLLCANEGPLRELLPALSSSFELAGAAQELKAQLGRLFGPPEVRLTRQPERLLLIDLAERSLIEAQFIEQAFSQILLPEFFPSATSRGTESSPSRNFRLLASYPKVLSNLARVMACAGQRCGTHVSFRALWASIAVAITGGATAEQVRLAGELGAYPLDNLIDCTQPLVLPDAIRRYADPALIPMPSLDLDIWFKGKPERGEWLLNDADMSMTGKYSPATLLRVASPEYAQARFSSLKRLVTLAHSEGQALLNAIEAEQCLPRSFADDMLLSLVLDGIRRCYVSAAQEQDLPAWLRSGLPLWTNLTYEEVPLQKRPHVAVCSLPSSAFCIIRPAWVEWLNHKLGAPPELAWLQHRDSGAMLRLEPALLTQLRRASKSAGPLETPDLVARFLSRLSGWEERQLAEHTAEQHVAVLQQPRGRVLVTTRISTSHGGAQYVE